jgi:hypothetical protein
MNAKNFLLRRDFAPDESSGEDTLSESSWELHPHKKPSTKRILDLLI